MDSPLKRLDLCLKIASACRSHLLLAIEPDVERSTSVPEVLSGLIKTCIHKKAPIYTVNATAETDLAFVLEQSLGGVIGAEAVEEEAVKSKKTSVVTVVIIQDVEKLIQSDQVLLYELMLNEQESTQERHTMIIGTTTDSELPQIHPNLLDAFLLCPPFSNKVFPDVTKGLPPKTTLSKPVSLYIRDAVSTLRQDPSFLSLALRPTAAKTIEKIIEVSGLSGTLATVRESIPFILSHRLLMAPSLRDLGENKEALILASIAVVPVPT